MTMQSKSMSDTEHTGTRSLSEEAASLGRAVQSTAREEFSRIKGMVEAGKERATEWRGGLESNIRSKPIQSVLIAAAVGAVIGIIASRRSH